LWQKEVLDGASEEQGIGIRYNLLSKGTGWGRKAAAENIAAGEEED
jgi:hypothetical protein